MKVDDQYLAGILAKEILYIAETPRGQFDSLSYAVLEKDGETEFLSCREVGATAWTKFKRFCRSGRVKEFEFTLEGPGGAAVPRLGWSCGDNCE